MRTVLMEPVVSKRDVSGSAMQAVPSAPIHPLALSVGVWGYRLTA